MYIYAIHICTYVYGKDTKIFRNRKRPPEDFRPCDEKNIPLRAWPFRGESPSLQPH